MSITSLMLSSSKAYKEETVPGYIPRGATKARGRVSSVNAAARSLFFLQQSLCSKRQSRDLIQRRARAHRPKP